MDRWLFSPRCLCPPFCREFAKGAGVRQILERIEQASTRPVNPEQEVSVGLFKLNAVTAREWPCLTELSSGFHSGDRLSEIYRHVCWGKGRDVVMLSVKGLDQSVEIVGCL